MLTSFVFRLVPVCALGMAIGCGGDDGEPAAADTPATSPSGATSSSGSAEQPALRASDCPGAPTQVTVVPIAPVWNGLIELTYTVPGGVPGSTELQLFDPTLGTWSSAYGQLGQRADGTYVSWVTPQVSESNKSAERKARVRSRLEGCPPSAWAESSPFTLGDPFAATTWVATFTHPQANATFSVSNASSGTFGGPYSLASQPVVHSVTFNADGTEAETVSFAVTSGTPGDLYASCTFQLAFTGRWSMDYRTGAFLISERTPKVGAASAGSTCVAPPLAELAINQPGFVLPQISGSFNVDYTPLLQAPPGKPSMAPYFLAQSLQQVFPAVNDVVGEATATVYGYFSPNQISYERQ